jgi:anaerobic selenocysteine-containing dehydrogenase
MAAADAAGTIRTTCPHDCPSVCALTVERLAPDRIGRVHGNRDNPYTDGVICAKVARYAERVHNPDRLTTPLLRDGPKGSGRFKPIGWDEALDRVAEAFDAARRRLGPQTLWPYHYAGTMGLVQRDGIERMRSLLGTSLQHSTICVALADAGWRAGVGHKWGVDPREMIESDVIVLWGLNAVSTQVNVMHWVSKARKGRGARLVVIDPYRNATADKADLHLMLRPGTDGALACAVMHVLLRDGLADRDYMARHTDDPEGLERHLWDRTPTWAAAITGLSEEQIEAFAHLYGGTKRSFLRLGYGFTRQRNGAAAMHAASCLPAVTGAWAHRGGGALFSMSGLMAVDMDLITAESHRDGSQRWLDQSRIGAVLTGDRSALAGGPPVTAMLIQNTNPMVVAPDSATVARGFAREDLFVCVHEQIMTETARMADVVLPATTFLEHDDLYKAGGHTFLNVGLKALEPPGEARCNHDVIRALMKRLDAPDHVADDMDARELVEETLRLSGFPRADEIAAAGGVDCARSFQVHHFTDGFGHPDGRFRFHGAWRGAEAARMPDLPDHMAATEAPDAAHPFRLVTAPARHFLNTSFNETPTGRRQQGNRPVVMVRPDEADRLGITEGARVRLGNTRASVALHARLFDGLPPATLVVESLWANDTFEEGLGINALVGADPGPPNGGAAFHDAAVWLRPDPVPEPLP